MPELINMVEIQNSYITAILTSILSQSFHSFISTIEVRKYNEQNEQLTRKV